MIPATREAVATMLTYWRAQGCLHSHDTAVFLFRSIAGTVQEDDPTVTPLRVAEVAEELGFVTIQRDGAALARTRTDEEDGT